MLCPVRMILTVYVSVCHTLKWSGMISIRPRPKIIRQWYLGQRAQKMYRFLSEPSVYNESFEVKMIS